jgi:hypothetical protein
MIVIRFVAELDIVPSHSESLKDLCKTYVGLAEKSSFSLVADGLKTS